MMYYKVSAIFQFLAEGEIVLILILYDLLFARLIMEFILK